MIKEIERAEKKEKSEKIENIKNMEKIENMENIEEQESYLDLALLDYQGAHVYPCHMPGHKRQPMGDWTPEAIDITEIDGFDNLHHAEEILKIGQERLAQVFGAEESFFLVNGSSCGLLAAICGSVKKGDRILVSRNCHKAVYHAIYLMELRAEFIYPEATDFGIQGVISWKAVEEMLQQFPDAKAVVLTSPTYDGVVSHISEIASVVHEREIPLIVDEAHGAHFGFSKGFPEKALALGADICVESVHKTLPAFTQTAVLHLRKNPRVNRGRIKRYLEIYQTSSPSYILMAGIDRCVRILKEQGPQLFAQFEARLDDFYQKCQELKYIQVLGDGAQDPGIWQRDRSKILISAHALGMTGQELHQYLLEEKRLQMEMASGHYVTAIMTIFDTQEGFERLWEAIAELDAEAARSDDNKSKILTCQDLYPRAIKREELFQAMDGKTERILLADSAGEISGEFIYLYPPGIPIVAPGEQITSEILKNIQICKDRGMHVEGMQDPEGIWIQIEKYS